MGSPSVRPPRSTISPHRLSALLLLGLTTFTLIRVANAQLLFPTAHDQLAFDYAETVISPSGSSQAGPAKAQPGELWSEGGYKRVPKIAIVGAGAAGE